jgi:hypothetical protein
MSERESYPLAPGWKEPTTSRDAALAIAPKARTLEARVFAFLQDRGPHTADEVADALGISPFSIRPRFSALLARRLIEETGERHKNESGHAAKVWRVRNIQRERDRETKSNRPNLASLEDDNVVELRSADVPITDDWGDEGGERDQANATNLSHLADDDNVDELHPSSP